MQDISTFKMLHFLLFLFIVVNLFIIDITFFSNIPAKSDSIKIGPTVVLEPSLPPQNNTQLTTYTTAQSLSCPVSCVNLITQATQSAQIERVGSVPNPTTPPTLPASQTGSTAHIYYIPFGSGATTKSDWEDLTSTETIIDDASYGSIKSVQLTYALRNPTQNGKISVRLYNATDKYVVYGSELEMEGASAQSITTAPFAFPKGNKLYRIQMRSTLSFDVYLDNAKLKIVTQ